MRSLMERGAPPSAKADNAVTPLHIAAKVGNADAARLLLSHGADPDARTTDRVYTPLHLAVKFGHVEVIRALCSGGGGGGGGGGGSGDGGGNHAAARGSASVSAAGLGGITPLHIACRRGRTKCAAALLDGGADMVGFARGEHSTTTTSTTSSFSSSASCFFFSRRYELSPLFSVPNCKSPCV